MSNDESPPGLPFPFATKHELNDIALGLGVFAGSIVLVLRERGILDARGVEAVLEQAKDTLASGAAEYPAAVAIIDRVSAYVRETLTHFASMPRGPMGEA